MEKRAFFALAVAFAAVTIFSSSTTVVSHAGDSLKSILGEENLGSWDAEAPGPAYEVSKLVLAQNRTKRPDILTRFRKYRGGWDIANKHYWASVGFTGSAAFIIAVLWFVSFGLALVVLYCCGWKIDLNGKESSWPHRICLWLLLLLTSAAAIGCILLSVGQNDFHEEALGTLDFVVNQSEYTVQTLRNVTGYLSVAKNVSVAQIFLPSDVKGDIDRLNVDLNTAADTLEQQTSDNSSRIEKVFNTVRSALITVTAVMLVITIIGLVLSLLGRQRAIHMCVISGWLLVTVTFILCGVFVILNNTITDTCMAMGEWVENPHAETALSNILPCVDQKTTNQTLFKSKQVINDIVNMVNGFVDSVANSNPPPQAGGPVYYNQSGPSIPHLCYLYDSNLQDRNCSDQELSMQNASLVWENFTCLASADGLCTTVGRLTPKMYAELVAAVNVSYALQHYAPPLLSLQNCDFVRDTFVRITSGYCPPLEHHLHTVNVGLALISVGVMLSLVLWIIYANRPQREDVFAGIALRLRIGGKNNDNNNNNIA
ncbi:Unknown protein [Striga hermonthica]|uniref:Uncharacterized protein n=1 Tax=Striga hermonthica TaxID=68872 RepID=A0A9N7NF13_STRHE|nr:Unknown protein [Striga hermonthica]